MTRSTVPRAGEAPRDKVQGRNRGRGFPRLWQYITHPAHCKEENTDFLEIDAPGAKFQPGGAAYGTAGTRRRHPGVKFSAGRSQRPAGPGGASHHGAKKRVSVVQIYRFADDNKLNLVEIHGTMIQTCPVLNLSDGGETL